MKFTKEEISLCKQVAEKHRREIGYGDRYEFRDDVYLITSKHEPDMSDITIPLWTIPDCISWLDETKDITIRICSHPDINQTTVEYDDTEYHGKTPLEACLKAVLAVLKESNGGKVEKD